MKTLDLDINGSMPEFFTGKVIKSIKSGDVFCISYYENGYLHNTKGPARIFYDKVKLWYLDGARWPREVWFELLTPEQKIDALFNLENWT